MVSEGTNDVELDRQVWPTYEGRLSPTLGYFLHVAKLHQANRVYTKEYRNKLEAVRQAVDRQVDELSQLHQHLESTHNLETGELVKIDAEMTQAISANGGLLEQLTAVERLRLGAQVAWQNMAKFIAVTDRGAGSLFDFDREEYEALDVQIKIDLKYARTARQRAEEGYRLTDLRLRQVRKEQADRQSELTLVQTSLNLGGLIAALATVGAVGLHVDLPMVLQWAIVSAVAAIAFALPMLVMHRPSYGRPDRLAIAIAIGAIGWLAAQC